MTTDKKTIETTTNETLGFGFYSQSNRKVLASWIKVWTAYPDLCIRSRLSREQYAMVFAQIALRIMLKAQEKGKTQVEVAETLCRWFASLGFENKSAVNQAWEELRVVLPDGKREQFYADSGNTLMSVSSSLDDL
jgi:hypothetical protein